MKSKDILIVLAFGCLVPFLVENAEAEPTSGSDVTVVRIEAESPWVSGASADRAKVRAIVDETSNIKELAFV